MTKETTKKTYTPFEYTRVFYNVKNNLKTLYK